MTDSDPLLMNTDSEANMRSGTKPYVALLFTQQADVVKIPSVNITTAATFEVWINPSASTPLGYIIFKKSTFAIALQDRELVVAFGNQHPGWKWIHSDWRAKLDEWAHIAVTYDAEEGETRIYANGKLQKKAVVKGELLKCNNALQVGVKSFKKTGQTKTRYVGLVADVRIWEKALSEEIIEEVWGTPLQGDEDGLLGYWPLDEATGCRVLDHTANGQHGDANGPVWHMSVSVPTPSLGQAMLKVLHNALGSDVRLRAGRDGGVVTAHRAILAARCDVFRAMFTSGMREESQSEIELPDVTTKILKMLLEFLYTDELDVPPNLAIDLFIVADKYCLTRLERMCECVILRTLSTENVCHILETADALNAEQLRGIAFRWIIHNFGEVLKSPGYAELDRKLQFAVNNAASKMHFEANLKQANAVDNTNNATPSS